MTITDRDRMRCCCGHVNVIGGEIIDPGPCPVHDLGTEPEPEPVQGSEKLAGNSEPLPAPTWPDWLSPEYQAIVKMVKDAMRRAEDDICNSEDASGLPRTAEGERNVYAGAIVSAFKRAGWFPPEVK